MANVTETPGNPAYDLMAKKDMLMSLPTLEELRQQMVAIMRIATGIKEPKRRVFIRTCESQPTLEKLQAYLFNWLLAADGDRVWSPREGTEFGRHARGNTTRTGSGSNSQFPSRKYRTRNDTGAVARPPNPLQGAERIGRHAVRGVGRPLFSPLFEET
jgi:hypothetical protein